VRWFELDHPDTQYDKLQRLHRLGIDVSHVTFVEADFRTDDVAALLLAAGVSIDEPSLVLCEGVVVYLDPAVFDSLAIALHQVAARDSTMALSMSTESDESRRAVFASKVAAVGEPVRSNLTHDDALATLQRAGWSVTPDTPAARRLGFVDCTA
jgi:methyltransferase (TIGR00027 family)